MTVTLPAIGYARVSTDEQAREGMSLKVQRERIPHRPQRHAGCPPDPPVRLSVTPMRLVGTR